MLPRRTAAEILSRDQDAGALVARIIEYKIRVLLAIGAKPPIVKKEFSKAGFFNSFQELLRDDLVGIDVDPIQRRHPAEMHVKWFHRTSLIQPSSPLEQGVLLSAAVFRAERGISGARGTNHRDANSSLLKLPIANIRKM